MSMPQLKSRKGHSNKRKDARVKGCWLAWRGAFKSHFSWSFKVTQRKFHFFFFTKVETELSKYCCWCISRWGSEMSFTCTILQILTTKTKKCISRWNMSWYLLFRIKLKSLTGNFNLIWGYQLDHRPQLWFVYSFFFFVSLRVLVFYIV